MILPPKATKKSHAFSVHGYKFEDPYFWLREKENPEVIKLLEAENNWTSATLKPYQKTEEKIFSELKARYKQEDIDVPVEKGPFVYYRKFLTGKEYPIYCRHLTADSSKEETLLDLNEYAVKSEYVSLGVFTVSPDHRLLAYSIDTDGSERYKIYFKDLNTQTFLPDVIENTSTCCVWANDNQTIFYSRLNERLRPDKIFRHRLGSESQNDQVVYHETDPEYFAYVSKTRDKRWIVFESSGAVTSEASLISADNPTEALRIFSKRKEKVEYSIESYDGGFFIHTNLDAVNFRILRCSWDKTAMSEWQPFIEHRPEVLLTSIDAFQKYLVISSRQRGLPQLHVYDFATQKSAEIPFDEATYGVWGDNNPNFESETFRFGYSSLRTPPQVVSCDLKTKKLTVLKQEEIPSGFNADDYELERLWARSHDGVEVPISVIYKKNLDRNKPHPCYLQGYGAYGSYYPATFRRTAFSLIDRGFIFAFAHIRGGSDMGRPWYEDGKFLKKKNTFADFIACSEHLVQTKRTSPSQLVIGGGSAGGMLIGACINARPDLFKVAVAHVPFVDVINTMLDDSLPLTTIEYQEWGNPKDKTYFDYMLSYSPYDNVQAKSYPHLFVTAGFNDPRVTYWEPLKWVQKLRELKTDKNNICLLTNMGAGHGGVSGRFAALKEYAIEYTFILSALKLI